MVSSSTDIHRYRVAIPQEDLDDLKYRLDRMRWPGDAPTEGWAYGVPTDYLKPLVEYWRTEYDWRKVEARLNAYPQFVTTIDGEQVHFIHVKSPEVNATPLLCTHGWPMSVIEYLNLVEPLTNPTAHGGKAEEAIMRWTPYDRGSHFSPHDAPDLLLADIREFYGSLR